MRQVNSLNHTRWECKYHHKKCLHFSGSITFYFPYKESLFGEDFRPHHQGGQEGRYLWNVSHHDQEYKQDSHPG